MSDEPTPPSRPWWPRLLPLLIALGGGALYLHRIHIDDAFITYRYAANVAHSGTLAYGGSSSFASTAPGYALVLGAFGWIGLDIPTMGSLLGAAAIGLSGALVASWLGSSGLVAALAGGLLVAVSPLAWLVLGMEVNLAIALVLLGFLLSERDHDRWATVALAAATLLRFDAVAAAAAWGLWMLVRHRWRALALGALYGGLVLAGQGLMVWGFDVPLFPSTLSSKQAQQTLGISGFFPNTSWLEAIALLARAYTAQTWLYLSILLCALVGLLRLGHRSPSDRPVLLLCLWTLLHILLYQLLGVTPYLWYYVPIWVALSALAASGAAWLVQRAPRSEGQAALGMIALLLLLGGPLISHLRMVQHLQPGTLEAEPSLASKVLPELKARPYRAAGAWLAANSAPTARVGVTEVGLLGYYSQRPMVDFLGLLDAEVAAALGRGELSWALYSRQPEYLVLSERNPVYGFSIYRDAWFQAAYEPVHRVPGEGFWGGDLTIYKRVVERQPTGAVRTPLPPMSVKGDIVVDGSLELLGLTQRAGPWKPGQATGSTLYWHVLQPPSRQIKVIFHIVDEAGALVAGFDFLPLLGARPTTEWQTGEHLADFVPIALPQLWESPTALRYELIFLDATSEEPLPVEQNGAALPPPIYLDATTLRPAEVPLALSVPHEAEPATVTLGDFSLAPRQLFTDDAPQLELQIAGCDCPVELTVELLDAISREALWQQEIRIEEPGPASLMIDVEPPLPPGWLPLRLSARKDDRPLLHLDSLGHIVSESVPLSPLFRAP